MAATPPSATVITASEYAKLEIAAKEAGSAYVSGQLTIKIHKNRRILESRIGIVSHRETALIHISVDVIQCFSDSSITEVECVVYPKSWELVQRHKPVPRNLPFTEQAQTKLLLPLTRDTAAGIISVFYNNFQDPVDKATQVVSPTKSGAEEEIGRIVTTYYVSCIVYMTGMDLTDLIIDSTQFDALVDDSLVVTVGQRARYNSLRQRKDIRMDVVAFQAVYGAYAMCRPVLNKKNFGQWIKKRYDSFLSSLGLPQSNIALLDYQRGGEKVNRTVSTKLDLRRVVYKTATNNDPDPTISMISAHVKLLVSYADMTTFTLINVVIAKGGSVVVIGGNSDKLIQFYNELKTVENKLTNDGYTVSDMPFVKLIYPYLQCFKTTDYSRFVTIAKIIEKTENPTSNTLGDYTFRSQESEIDTQHIEQFLRYQRDNKVFTIDHASKETIISLLGEDKVHLFNQAQQLIDMIERQRQLGFQRH